MVTCFQSKTRESGLNDRFTRAAYFDTTSFLVYYEAILLFRGPHLSFLSFFFCSLSIASAATGPPVLKLAQIESDRINHSPVSIHTHTYIHTHRGQQFVVLSKSAVSRSGILLYAGPVKEIHAEILKIIF